MDNDFDPSMNFLHERDPQLRKFFEPKTVAVIGASETEGSVGRTLMENLTKHPFGGEVIPINPKREAVFGIKTFANVKSVPQDIDLAIIVIPAKFVPSIVQECVEKQIPAAVIISAGFKEMGEPGILLEQEIMEHARAGHLRVIGPNCLGVMNPCTNMNATFAATSALKGNIAFISQSGALCTAVLDWSLKEKVGFSAFVSIGSMVDVNWGDLIHYFGNDPETKSILIYMESIGDPRAFLSAAREVALTKPIILIKAGRTKESAAAAASHTGALAGSDDAFTAALNRVGVLRVDTIAELFAMAEALGKQPIPKGPRLTIITNAGGPGVIATDALISSGGKLSEISAQSMNAYNAFLPAPWSHSNPIDILGDASPDIYAKSVEVAMKDPETDGLLVVLTPQAMTDPTQTAKLLKPFGKGDKPVLASWMGAESVAAGDAILADSGIPSFAFPDMACKIFSLMWRHSENLKAIYEVPSLLSDYRVDDKKVAQILQKARDEKRLILDEYESKQILDAYHIPTVDTRIAHSVEEAAQLAEEMQFPLVLKIYSHTITHKSDVGGVKLNLGSVEAVKQAYQEIYDAVVKNVGLEHFQGVTVQKMIQMDGYELILGSTVDPEFGPVLLFGSGGKLVEVYQDRALALPPLTTTLAKRMMEQTKVYEALKGVRGKASIDLEKLEKLLVQFSRLSVEQPWIKECDINPLLVNEETFIALDARVILHDLDEKDLPKSAIRPYPTQYIERVVLKDSHEVLLRPIRPEDEPLLIQFHKTLSEETVRQRYLKKIAYDERVAHERMIRLCFNDYDREIAIVAEYEGKIIGIARLTKGSNPTQAIFSMTVTDCFQNKGLGLKLLEKVLQIASCENITHVFAYMFEENTLMQKLVQRFGFQIHKSHGLLIAEYQCK